MCDFTICDDKSVFAEWHVTVDMRVLPCLLCESCHYSFINAGMDGRGTGLLKWDFIQLLNRPDIIPWNPEGESDAQTV